VLTEQTLHSIKHVLVLAEFKASFIFLAEFFELFGFPSLELLVAQNEDVVDGLELMPYFFEEDVTN